jgi:chemosensory pili system protein ChpA (sensor histidine kinase/response regulator)
MEILAHRSARLVAAVAVLEERLRMARALPDGDGAAAAACCREMQQAVVRFGAQVGAAGATGLAQAAEWLSANLEYLSHQQRDLLPEVRASVQRWPQLASDYVAGQEPLQAAAMRLVQFAEQRVWTLRPSPAGSANILGRLTAFEAAERSLTTARSEGKNHAFAVAPVPETVVESLEPAVAPVVVQGSVEPDQTPVVATPSLDTALLGLAAAAASLAESAPGHRDAALVSYGEQLIAVVDAAQSSSAFGLADTCGLMFERIEGVRELSCIASISETPGWLLAALDFAALAQSLASAPNDTDVVASLLQCLQHPDWPTPLGAAEVGALRAVFGLPEETEAEEAPFGDRLAPPALPLNLPAQQQIDPENLTLLAAEFPAMLAAMSADLDAARSDPAALETCADVFERGANAVEAAGLVALSHVLAHVARRIRAARPRLSIEQHAWLLGFTLPVRAYLVAPMESFTASTLIESMLEAGPWMALAPETAADLEQALPRVLLVVDATKPQRTQEATPEQVSLAIPADLNPELLEGLLSELPVQSADFAAAMQRVASGDASMDDLDVAKRAAHTLKGAAHTVGVLGIANLTHHVEDILIALTKHERMPRGHLAETLVAAADCLEAMSEALLGAGPTPHDAQQTLQQVLDWANRIDADGVPEDDEAAPVEALAQDAPAVEVPAAVPAPALPAGEAGAPVAATENVLRLPASLVDELLRLVGETMIANTQIKEQLRLTMEHTRAATKQNTALQGLAAELEQLVDVRGVTASFGTTRTHGDFDALEFEHFNELHTVTRRLIEAATDSREMSLAGEQRLGTLAELLESQGQLATENQNVVMKARQVPVASVVARLQRSVRQTARLLDKRVELVVTGAQTTIDSEVLNGLVDPLMHLLRNAVDHGIEGGDRRAALGKPAVGRVDLSFVREGASVVVRVTDDGAGLDLPRIRTKAESRGDLAAGQQATDDAIARLILLPGFSTRADATHVSGRGIGLDAVYTRVQALKGTLRLHAAAGHGLTVELRLPVSLMTTHGLLVRHNDQVVAISSYGIHDIRYVTRDQVRARGTGYVYEQDGQEYELEQLDALLGRPREDKRDWFPALLVHTDSGALRAVRVHEVIDTQEIVVKSLGPYVSRPYGVVGVTILGDGSIAPVFDLPQLVRFPQQAARAAAPASTSSTPVQNKRSALVVDDSLSARRAAAQLMRDAGFDVRTAIDGSEAATLLEKWVPDIILVDMEMPRMNGLELTTHVRTRAASRHVPIVMITSRSTDKHRRQAQNAGVNVYLTKPFSDDELLEHAVRLTAGAAVPA